MKDTMNSFSWSKALLMLGCLSLGSGTILAQDTTDPENEDEIVEIFDDPNATLPEAVNSLIALPADASAEAVEAAQAGLDTANAARERRQQGQDTAATARERRAEMSREMSETGRQMAERAAEDRKEFGRAKRDGETRPTPPAPPVPPRP
jgi:type IV secretory pathway VirB10-like protein